ncbi:MAG: hypothetical protein IJC56_09495 [Clostridia bacterium]|nr:hypothetical protein [Clostridia bacterium]
MKRLMATIIALIIAMACMTCSAEAAIPAEVQAFYDAFCEMTGTDIEGEIIYAENYDAYNSLEDTTFLTVTLGRTQYDSFYYWRVAEDMMVTVCCMGEKAVAYILDGKMLPVQAGSSPYIYAFYGFTDAYSELFPADRNDFYPESMLYSNDALDESAAESGTILQSSIDYGDMLATVCLLNSFDTYWDPFFADRRDLFSIQLQPYSAYEGLEMTAQENHDVTCYMMLEANLAIVQGTLDALQ